MEPYLQQFGIILLDKERILAEISSNNACYWAEIPWHMITLNASQGAFVLDLSNCKISLSEASLETSIYRF